MPNANRSTIAKARPIGHGRPNGDAAYAHGSNVARPEADAGVQESLLAEQRELGNNLGERKVESAWPGKVTGRDTVNATISMRTDFLVGTGIYEYRIDFGSGYRIYFGKDGDRLVILVGGGTKKRQQEDIKTALARWQDYKQRKGAER